MSVHVLWEGMSYRRIIRTCHMGGHVLQGHVLL